MSVFVSLYLGSASLLSKEKLLLSVLSVQLHQEYITVVVPLFLIHDTINGLDIASQVSPLIR